MNGMLDYWAMLNTLVIMLALGLAEGRSDSGSTPGRLLRWVLGYNLLIPALALFGLKTWSTLPADTLAAAALCIASAGGTSSGAFVAKVHGSPRLASRLIVLTLGLSLLAVGLFSHWHWIALGPLSLGGLAVYLLGMTLTPLGTGRVIRQVFPALAARWQPRLERLGSLLVILLVLALALRYGRDILTGPVEPLVVGGVLVVLFTLPPLLEPVATVRRTVALVTLIRNLTLALSILAVLPNATALAPTVLAFGLFMYLTAGLLIWLWNTPA